MKNNFLYKVNSHYAALKVFLTNLETKDFTEKVKMPRYSSRVSLSFVDLDLPKLPQQECNKCFRNIVQTTMDFLDTMIALINIQEGKIKITKTYTKPEDFFNFLNEELKEEIQRVSRGRALSYKAKVKLMNLDKFSTEALNSYIDLRHCLEHNKEIPENDVKLKFKQSIMLANGQKIKKMPFIATTGVIQCRIAKGQKTFKADAKVEISEQIIESVIFTLHAHIALKIIESVCSRKRKNIT
ncbi:hypothetical protein KKG82_03715 [Patescibacteria group bacterium]|nr:hypothetical protein [Patescibacteria group bacterium]